MDPVNALPPPGRIRIWPLVVIYCVLGGCSLLRSSDGLPLVHTVIQSRPLCTNAPQRRPLSMLPTQFHLVTDRDGLVWIALDSQGYENLSRNIGSLRLALDEDRHIIGYYSDCLRGDDRGRPSTAGGSGQ